MQTHPNEFYDAIVIGSGYGGSVSAFRLAESGLKVAVLETGYHHKAPNMPRGEESEWNPQEGHYGPHTVHRLSKSVTAWYGTAVGGGSIVNDDTPPQVSIGNAVVIAIQIAIVGAIVARAPDQHIRVRQVGTVAQRRCTIVPAIVEAILSAESSAERAAFESADGPAVVSS